MSNLMNELVLAAKAHGVPCVVIGGYTFDDDDDDFVTKVPDDVEDLPEPVADPSGDAEELARLRSQVQTLTQQLQDAQSSSPAQGQGGGQIQSGDYGDADDQDLGSLGLDDEKLEKKLRRLGYDTIGKCREAFMEGKLADKKIKKDWLIEVGMKLAGAGPSLRPAAATAGGAAAPASGDVPTGHADRPWEERLALAKQKQATLDEMRSALNKKQAEIQKEYTAKGKDIPEDEDEALVELEDSITLMEGQLVAMRWCMALNVDPAITLDQALAEANLGPWMDNPQPRLAPAEASG